MSAITFPTASSEKDVFVTVSALEGGHLTLPEHLFVTDAEPGRKRTLPSLCFLIQHPSQSKNDAGRQTNMVFDLGLKRDLQGYMPAMQTHIAARQPIHTSPDVAESLKAGNINPATDVDYVILSHVHWDHEGTPSDFERATFVVGHGTLHLLENGAPPHYPQELFNHQLLPRERVWEFAASPLPEAEFGPGREYIGEKGAGIKGKQWQKLQSASGETLFPAVIDVFDDGSIYLIDSPGHLFGHMNLLARVGATKWVYLGGDCCHDPRILTGEKGIALYDDGTGTGHLRSVHVNTAVARATLDRIQHLLGSETGTVDIECIVAHDGDWRKSNPHRFFQHK